MKQVTIRQLVRQVSKIEEWLPCEVVRDGEVIAVMYAPNDGRQPIGCDFKGETVMDNDVRQASKANTMSDKLTELPLSKQKQAQSTW